LHEAEQLTTDEWSEIFNTPIGIQLFGKWTKKRNVTC
jgi:hypothetical protein